MSEQLSFDLRARSSVSGRAINSYEAASHFARQFSMWVPRLQSADADVLPDMDNAKARSRDLVRNNPFGKNAMRIKGDSIIGPGLRLSLKPDALAMGIEAEAARDWARKVERLWENYANGIHKAADARRMQTFNSLCRTAHNALFQDGEALATVVYRNDGPSVFGTCLQLVSSDRLSNPNFAPDSPTLRKGVELNRYSEPVAYHIREAHPADVVMGDFGGARWKRIRRATATGRPNVIHLFDHDREEMTRGITEFAASIKPMKMLSHYEDVTLERAIIQAIFAAAIETEMDYDSAMAAIGADKLKQTGLNPLTAMSIDHMSQVADFHKEAGFQWGGAKALHLLPNEELKLYRSETPDNAFADFEAAILRGIAAGTATPISALSQNYKDINYSAARAALHDVWRHYLTLRQLLVDGFCWPFFFAWLEEAVAKEIVPLPDGVEDFYAAAPALCKGRWTSWGKPMIDPVKERKAQQMALAMGVETLESIAANDGQDWEELLEQRARETAKMKELGPGGHHPFSGTDEPTDEQSRSESA